MTYIRIEPAAADKKRLINARNAGDRIRSRINLLFGQDRQIMALFYENGQSKKEIALIVGIHASNVSRRIRKLTTALASGPYIQCLRNRRFFTDGQLEIARQYYLGSLALKTIARNIGISRHEVKAVIDYLKLVISNMN